MKVGKTGALVAAVAVNLAIGLGLEADIVAAQAPQEPLPSDNASRPSPSRPITPSGSAASAKPDGVMGQEEESAAWQGCQPENSSIGGNSSALAYARLIEKELGVPPTVDCGANVELPIYVNGAKTIGDPGLHQCDNPSLQVGDCMSGSSVQRYVGKDVDGSTRHEVVWVSFCRHDGRDDEFGYDIPDSVQMIGYNRVTGATAFFESADNREWTHVDPATNKLMGQMPGIDDPEAFDRAYVRSDTQCVACHQADPFIHNPFIDGATRAGAPNQTVVPRIGGRRSRSNTPYYVIGGADWDMRTIHIEDNECLGCHRIGMKTVEEFMGDHWHPNQHMPPNDPGSLAGHFEQLLACWTNGPENTPGCDWIIPPAGDCPSQVVGDDYPYQKSFNRASPEELEWTERPPFANPHLTAHQPPSG
ncbi:MAG: hypothetical protein F4Y86_12020 [Gammaproteobacteria bacterium]|nr:hypothetical protein [Gammaproteobacteria bacterium]